MRPSLSQLHQIQPEFLVKVVPFLIVALLWQYVRHAAKRAKARRLGCLPVKSTPQRLPDFGLSNVFQVMNAFKSGKLLELTESRFQTAKASTVAITTLGRTTIWTMDPKNVQSILALDFKSWSIGSRRKRAFHSLLGKGIFTSDGEDWKHSRELLRPSFLKRRTSSVHLFEPHISAFLKCIPSDGKTIVDLHELFLHLTMDISTQFLFGKSTRRLSQQDNENTASFAAAFERAQEAAGAATRNGPMGTLLDLRGASKDVALVHDFVDSIIADRLRLEKNAGGLSSSDYIFLDELIHRFSDPVRVRSELLQILLAGRDTTAAMLTNFWWCISRHSEAATRLRHEIEQLQGAHPTFEQVKELKYLMAAVNESLRLYPVVPVNLREAVEDTTLPMGGGKDGQSPVFVPKGQAVMWNLWTMHRREDVYGSDAAYFCPERWLGGDGPPLRPGFAFLPFNGGPRICLGQQFALTEASYIIVRMMQEFNSIEGIDDGPWREKITLTTVNATGCRVKVTSHHSQTSPSKG
ncbi:cytochrome P450 52A1 [Xylariales sp. AK1849]|nr:cytochrome P450 52A1 [Xylariales sp. AK1849]